MVALPVPRVNFHADCAVVFDGDEVEGYWRTRNCNLCLTIIWVETGFANVAIDRPSPNAALIAVDIFLHDVLKLLSVY